MRHHCVVEVQPAEVSVTGDGFDVEESRTYVHARINIQEGNIQGAAAKVEDEHHPRFAAEPFCEDRRQWQQRWARRRGA